MKVPKERLLQKNRAVPAKPGAEGRDVEYEVEALGHRAEAEQTEQTALLEGAPLEQQFSVALAAQVEAKHEQVERIEERLEALVDVQASRMQRLQAAQPGMLALPAARASWQQQVKMQQARMRRLEGRLENVREIRDGMGVHGARIEELAHRKLRAQAPELVNDWEDMQEEQRQHQALRRQKEQEKTRRQGTEQGIASGRGRKLGMPS